MSISAAKRWGRVAGTGRAGDRGTLRQRMWKARWCYLFAAPSLLLACAFSFYPTIASWYFSLLDWSGFTSSMTFIGLANYQEVVHDSYFWGAFLRSFLFMFAAVPIKFVLTLIVAIILNDRLLRLSPVFRTLFFLPVVTTAAIDGIVMTFLFSPVNGPINRALIDVHVLSKPLDFLGNPHSALWTIVAVFIWKSFGIEMMYWLAALQIVPPDLYEAAKIDGAGRWALHRYLTVPIILPFAAIILILSVAGALHVFALVQTMTGGGPFFSSEVMEVYIYRTAFGGSQGVPRLGYASAAAVWFGVCVLVVALAQGLIARKANESRQALSTGGVR